REGKSYLTIAVGCTGGRHRSVIIVNELKKVLKKKYPVKIQYRDIEKSTV
ncbi:MAG: RNase adaptor protein RapZ, partial [Elusimicrobiota bacterium]|nr:RNase adaptor protein RapZ [Elusimicrobiota bacterium]